MAGYSGTPLPTKLGIKPASTVVLIDAPSGVITDLPDGVVVRTRASGKADVVVLFVINRRDFARRVAALGQMIFPNGGFWIAFPKKASGVQTDMTDHVVRELALPLGLVDNKICAIDDVWTGVRVVWRRELRS